MAAIDWLAKGSEPRQITKCCLEQNELISIGLVLVQFGSAGIVLDVIWAQSAFRLTSLDRLHSILISSKLKCSIGPKTWAKFQPMLGPWKCFFSIVAIAWGCFACLKTLAFCYSKYSICIAIFYTLFAIHIHIQSMNLLLIYRFCGSLKKGGNNRLQFSSFFLYRPQSVLIILLIMCYLSRDLLSRKFAYGFSELADCMIFLLRCCDRPSHSKMC